MAKRAKLAKSFSHIPPVWLWGFGLLAAVVVAYIPVWWAGYVWDDDALLINNPCIIGPLGLKEIWTTSAADICPFTQTTFWLEHAAWDLKPWPYHVVNVLLHAASAIVLWRLLLLLEVPGAWLGAALWALHPVQVESVAWISEMKNTESGLFFLLSIFFYARQLKEPGQSTWRYGLSLFFAALALASKSSTAILPLALGLAAWWVDGRWNWRRLPGLLPVFAMSAAAAALALFNVSNHDVNESSIMARGWPERLAMSGDVFWFYLGKLVWPHPVMALYPRWRIDPASAISYLPLAAMIALLFVLWLKRNSWGRPYFFALAYFIAVLLPVFGLINHYFMRFSFVSNHLQYLAGIGPLALAGAGITRFLPSVARTVATATLLGILAVLTWNRAWIYQSDEILWTKTLEQDPNLWSAHHNLGNFYAVHNRFDESISQLRQAVESNPQDAPAFTNLGLELSAAGLVDDGVAQLRNAVRLEPYLAAMHYNLATGLFDESKSEEALAELREALRLNPRYSNARNRLGNELLRQGKLDEALAEFQKAADFEPTNSDAISSVGLVYLRTGHYADAEAQFRRAERLNPTDDAIHLNLGDALVQLGHPDKAAIEYQKALDLNPQNTQAASHLAGARVMMQRSNLTK